VLANAESTKKEVETGIPLRVSNTRARGAKAWYHCGSWYGIFVNRPKEISPLPDETQPYTSVNINTAEAAAHNVVHLNLSRFDAIHVPRVWTLSFAMTEKPARQNPITVKSSNISDGLWFLFFVK
jgi:hypothetical protein